MSPRPRQIPVQTPAGRHLNKFLKFLHVGEANLTRLASLIAQDTLHPTLHPTQLTLQSRSPITAHHIQSLQNRGLQSAILL